MFFNLELTEDQANDVVQALDNASDDIRGRDACSVAARQMRESVDSNSN